MSNMSIGKIPCTDLFLTIMYVYHVALQAPSDKTLDWGKINKGVAPEVYENIYKKAVKHYNENVDKM